MACISVNSESDFSLQIMHTAEIGIAYFSAPWCEPCKIMESELIAAANQFANTVHVFRINVDTMKHLAEKYNIIAVPTLLFLQGGKPVKRIIGSVSQREIEKLLTALLKNPVQT